MTALLRIWGWLKRVPAGLKWAAAAFFGGLILAVRVMGTRYKVKDIRREAEEKREKIDEERDKLRDAAASGHGPNLRDEVLKNLRDEKID